MVLEQLGGLANGVLRRDGAIGPHLDSEFVVVGVLAKAGGFDREVHLAHRRVYGVDGDVAEGKVLVEVAVGGDVPAAGFKPDFDVELAAFADGGDGQIAVEHFHLVAGLDLAAERLTGVFDAQARGMHPLAEHFKGNLFQVQDDVGGVLHHAGDRAEFVRDALDADGGDGRALDGAEQNAAQAGSDGGPKAALERLGGEHSVALGERLGIGD